MIGVEVALAMSRAAWGDGLMTERLCGMELVWRSDDEAAVRSGYVGLEYERCGCGVGRAVSSGEA